MARRLTTAEIIAADYRVGKPHPDGKPWTKCCSSQNDGAFECQCFVKKPTLGRARLDNFLNCDSVVDDLIKAKGRFFCVHRTTPGGYYRECAGWFAKYSRKWGKKAKNGNHRTGPKGRTNQV